MKIKMPSMMAATNLSQKPAYFKLAGGLPAVLWICGSPAAQLRGWPQDWQKLVNSGASLPQAGQNIYSLP